MSGEELSVALAKIRPHVNSGLAHQKTPAVLLNALESTLKEQRAEQTPTAYFAALVTALGGLIQKDGTSALEEGDNVPAALYLLATVVPFVPQVVLRSQLSTITSLLGPLFPALAPHAPPLRSQIAIFGSVILALDNAHLNHSGVRQIFACILELAADQRPKVRRKAAETVKDILSAPPAPLAQHPFGELVATWIQTKLASAARGGDKMTDGADVAIHVLAFTKPISTYLPESVCHIFGMLCDSLTFRL